MKTTDDFFEARKLSEASLASMMKPLSKRDLAANALRDMFQSQQYKAKVPVKDIEHVLSSPRWAKIYGKKNVHASWKSLQKNDHVKKKGDHWVWTLGYMH